MAWNSQGIEVGAMVDADSHIAPVGDEFSLEKHLSRLEENKIEAALTWLSPHTYQGTEIEEYNRYVYEAAKRHPQRIIPFGWADPTVSVEHAKQMARTCVREYGFAGVKLNGAQNDFYIDDPELALPVIEVIASEGAMLAFHVGPDAYEKTHPLRAAEAARRFPDTIVLLVHMGMTDAMMHEATIRVAEQFSNVFLIASATLAALTKKAIERLGPERVLFGSDSPFKMTPVEIAATETMLNTEFTPEARDLVMGGNAVRLFGGTN